MSSWKTRRFWQTARVAPEDGGFAVYLDSRPLRTPAKAPLVVPTEPLAAALAAEWDAQEGVLDPSAMPLTRAANSAIDTVGPRRDAVVDEVAGYGATDLLCYRAGQPEALRARQRAGWDPLLRWSDTALGARLVVTEGVMFVPQPEASLAALHQRVAGFDAFGLTALHDLVALSNSLIIGLAAVAGLEPPEALWRVSRIDEDWQSEQWGIDSEAEEEAQARQQSFLQAVHFLRLARNAAAHR